MHEREAEKVVLGIEPMRATIDARTTSWAGLTSVMGERPRSSRGAAASRARVRQPLVAQAGIRRHWINKAMRTAKAGAGLPQYTLEARAGETNVSMFGLKDQ